MNEPYGFPNQPTRARGIEDFLSQGLPEQVRGKREDIDEDVKSSNGSGSGGSGSSPEPGPGPSPEPTESQDFGQVK